MPNNPAEYVFGIDTTHTGLGCRGGCRAFFRPSSSSDLTSLEDAAIRRDGHEIHVHHYHHQRREPAPMWTYAQTFHRRRRSLTAR